MKKINTRTQLIDSLPVGQKMENGQTVMLCQWCGKRFGTKRPDIAKFCCDAHKDKKNNNDRGLVGRRKAGVVRAMEINDDILATHYPKSLGEKRIPVRDILTEEFDLNAPYYEDRATDSYFFFDYGVSFFRDETAIIYRRDCVIVKGGMQLPWK